MSLYIRGIPELFCSLVLLHYVSEFKQVLNPRAYDFRMRSQAVSRIYLPFQLGVRLLRKASIPSRKSSLM
jgi:hypothetical protein